MNPPTTCIEDLPPEMIRNVFEFLLLKNLAACSMVNKRWHSIYGTLKLYTLAVTDYNMDRRLPPTKWYESNQPIREADRCRTAIFCHLAERPLLSNLNQLALSDYYARFDLNELNRFSRLVHLEIYIVYLDKENVNPRFNLNLPKLKVLALHGCKVRRCAVSVDCPELSTLLYPNAEKNWLDVKHPETIRKLETDWVGPKLYQFRSVECLVTDQFKVFCKATLISLPRLRELHYNRDIEVLVRCEFHNEVGTIDRIRQTLNKFLDDLTYLKENDFRFTFSGFQLTKKMLNGLDFGVRESFGRESVSNNYVYMRNYQLIEPDALQFVHYINYTRLLGHVTGEFPRCFSQKFAGIEEVLGEGVSIKSANQFLQFLNSLRFLRRLELKSPELGQEFFDQLPASARSLNKLALRPGKNDLQLNFDFIGNLSDLVELAIGQELSFESLFSVARWLGRLEKGVLFVQTRGECLCIEKEPHRAVWMIRKPSPVPYVVALESKNPEEIVDFFIERLQSKEAPDQLSINPHTL